MKPWLQDPDVTVYHGNCLSVMAQLPEMSVDAVVTDPPAGIAFMGREWDGNRGGRDAWVAWLTEVMAECLRVLKPGGHALVWALPRTSHWTGWAIEEAGFVVRDRVTHLFGQGFPKNLDVSKAIDREAGAEREVVGRYEHPDGGSRTATAGLHPSVYNDARGVEGWHTPITAPATPEAAAWQGWGTALKPATEDWWLARKPLAERTVARQVLATGTGAINVDGCRIDLNDETWDGNERNAHEDYSGQVYGEFGKQYAKPSNPAGRWPANVVLDEAAAEALDATVGESASGQPRAERGAGWIWSPGNGVPVGPQYGDRGGPSRFFKVTRPDEQEGECPCPTSPASTAEGCSPPPSASADSAPSDAATLGSPEARSGSERAASSPCPASTPSQSDSIPIPNHARDAVSPANIGITPTTPDRRPSSGSVTDATDGSTVGADAVNDDALNVSPSGFNRAFYTAKASAEERQGSSHPTVKPLDLMRWLVRMITPPAGIVLDPFAGSGTTGLACRQEGVRAILIERESEYLPDIANRLRQLSLFGEA